MEQSFALFYHIWCPPNSQSTRLIVDEQLRRVFRSGVTDAGSFHCCISGQDHQQIASYLSMFPWITSVTSTDDEGRFEGDTLVRLHDYCQNNTALQAVGYIHTKGIRLLGSDTEPALFRAVNSWRHFMEWGVIDRWREAIVLLQSYDAVGVNYRLDPWPHFGGNFWWSKASYVRSLVKPIAYNFPIDNELIQKQDARDGRGRDDRLYYERWLGINNPNAFSFYGYPFKDSGKTLSPEYHNLYLSDIEPFYRRNGF